MPILCDKKNYSIGDRDLEIILFIAAALILVFVKGIYDNRKKKAKIYSAIKREYGRFNSEDDMDERAVSDGRTFFENENASGDIFTIDDITANDLSLEYIFLKTDKTRSAAGSACYYNMLRTPVFDEKELSRREAILSFFEENGDKRTEVQAKLSRMPQRRAFSIHSCVNAFRTGKRGNVLAQYLNIVLLIASVIFAITVNTAASILFPFGVIAYNIATYYIQKSRTDGFIYGMRNIISMLNTAAGIVKMDVSACVRENEELKNCVSRLRKLKKASWAIRTDVSDDIMAIILDYANIIFHFDLISLNNAVSCAVKEEESILTLYRTLGYIDALINITSLRKAVREYCIPEFEKSAGPFLSFKEAYHPLLSDPVTSDLETSRHILITGSNASGKSTFLKTVALNAIFGQTIHTCFASEYKGSFFKVITGMSLSDNIISGESYYITEIKALKRIMDDNTDIPVLCFADEILRGTNTVERIAASTSALRFLAGQNKLVFAATHDIELTTLLNDIYVNYHFSESIDENGAICFDYMLKEGPSETRNAILMLKAYGYDEEITGRASEMAEEFVRTGAWKRP